MLIIAATIPVKPAALPAAIEAAIVMARATRTEPGCIEYGFYQDLEDPSRIHVFEKWENGDALAAHFQTPHMAEFSGMIGEFVDGAVSARRYEIASEGPVFPED